MSWITRTFGGWQQSQWSHTPSWHQTSLVLNERSSVIDYFLLTNLFEFLFVSLQQNILTDLVHHGFTQLPSLLEPTADRLHQFLQHRAQVRLDGLGAQLLCRLRHFDWRRKENVKCWNTNWTCRDTRTFSFWLRQVRDVYRVRGGEAV